MSPGKRRMAPYEGHSVSPTPPQTIGTNGASVRHRSDIEQAIENASGDLWWPGAMLGVVQMARTGHGFTLDNIRDLGVGEPPAPAYWGALIAAALRAGTVTTVGAKVLQDGRLGRVFWGTGG